MAKGRGDDGSYEYEHSAARGRVGRREVIGGGRGRQDPGDKRRAGQWLHVLPRSPLVARQHRHRSILERDKMAAGMHDWAGAGRSGTVDGPPVHSTTTRSSVRPPAAPRARQLLGGAPRGTPIGIAPVTGVGHVVPGLYHTAGR